MSQRPPAVERLFIEGPAGPIEALVEVPESVVPGVLAVCCHPHPLFGGTLQNKVVHTLARAALDLGVPAIRFNFRGVGGSVGEYDHGAGETADAVAVAAWGAARFAAPRLWAAGFSFGSFVAYGLAQAQAAERLVLQGDRDELVNHESVLDWTRTVTPPPRVELFEGADHFFHGRITELRERVRGWLEGREP